MTKGARDVAIGALVVGAGALLVYELVSGVGDAVGTGLSSIAALPGKAVDAVTSIVSGIFPADSISSNCGNGGCF